MSQQIEVNRSQMYSTSVYHLVQQKESKLSGAVRNETLKGKRGFYDAIGPVTAVKRQGRHSATPQMDTPHVRRSVTTADYEWSDRVDDQDKLRMIWDPTSYYVQAAAMAFNRAKDAVIRDAFDAVALTGQEGTTQVALPTSRMIAASTGSAHSVLNVNTLRKIKYMFDKLDIDEQIYMAVDAMDIQNLLKEVEVTSADYNTVKALVNGQVDSFMGIKFITYNALQLESEIIKFNNAGAYDAGGTSAQNYRKCFAWVQSGMLMATSENVTTKIAEDPTHGFNTIVYARMSIGATRMEEEKVLKVLVKTA